jgi:predicted ATPase
MELLERSREVEALDAWYGAVSATSHGRLVLVGGEAGVGKTVLVRRFCERCDGRTLWGSCEPLFTPRPLGPLLDVAELTGGDLAEVVAAGDRPHEVVVALIRELRRQTPAVLVLEDLHWADEATLDVVTVLAVRIADVPTLMLASYRDDELDRAHPLQAVLGAIVTAESVSRMRLLPLSAEAVATLAKPHGVDADALYRRTSGNPFFVTEVLGAAGGRDPAHGARRGAGSDGAPSSGREDAAGRGGDRAAAPSPSGSSRRWRAPPPAPSRNAWPPECSPRTAGMWRSGTSLRAWRWRSRSRPM